MSAFIVAKKTIDRIITRLSADSQPWTDTTRELRALGYLLAKAEDRDRLGYDLWAMNVDAVNQRYDESHVAETYAFEEVEVTDCQALKSMHCLHYQCSEGDVPERPLFKALEATSSELAEQIAVGLKGYDDAEWG